MADQATLRIILTEEGEQIQTTGGMNVSPQPGQQQTTPSGNQPVPLWQPPGANPQQSQPGQPSTWQQAFPWMGDNNNNPFRQTFQQTGLINSTMEDQQKRLQYQMMELQKQELEMRKEQLRLMREEQQSRKQMEKVFAAVNPFKFAAASAGYPLSAMMRGDEVGAASGVMDMVGTGAMMFGGPAGMAIGGVLKGVTAIVDTFRRLSRVIDERTNDLAPISGQISSAQGIAEVTKLQSDMRVNERIGDTLAERVIVQARYQAMMRERAAGFQEGFSNLEIGAMKAAMGEADKAKGLMQNVGAFGHGMQFASPFLMPGYFSSEAAKFLGMDNKKFNDFNSGMSPMEILFKTMQAVSKLQEQFGQAWEKMQENERKAELDKIMQDDAELGGLLLQRPPHPEQGVGKDVLDRIAAPPFGGF